MYIRVNGIVIVQRDVHTVCTMYIRVNGIVIVQRDVHTIDWRRRRVHNVRGISAYAIIMSWQVKCTIHPQSAPTSNTHTHNAQHSYIYKQLIRTTHTHNAQRHQTRGKVRSGSSSLMLIMQTCRTLSDKVWKPLRVNLFW